MNVITIHNTVLQSCSYLLWDARYPDICLVDCGDLSPVYGFMQQHGKSIRSVLLTHCHYDHIYGLRRLLSDCPDVEIRASRKTVCGLRDERINLSRYCGEPFRLDGRFRMTEIDSHSEFCILGNQVTVLETPGHDIGCLSYLIENKLFTGDSYIPGVPVFSKWKRSDREKAVENERLLKSMADELSSELYPGHYL